MMALCRAVQTRFYELYGYPGESVEGLAGCKSAGQGSYC